MDKKRKAIEENKEIRNKLNNNENNFIKKKDGHSHSTTKIEYNENGKRKINYDNSDNDSYKKDDKKGNSGYDPLGDVNKNYKSEKNHEQSKLDKLKISMKNPLTNKSNSDKYNKNLISKNHYEQTQPVKQNRYSPLDKNYDEKYSENAMQKKSKASTESHLKSIHNTSMDSFKDLDRKMDPKQAALAISKRQPDFQQYEKGRREGHQSKTLTSRSQINTQKGLNITPDKGNYTSVIKNKLGKIIPPRSHGQQQVANNQTSQLNNVFGGPRGGDTLNSRPLNMNKYPIQQQGRDLSKLEKLKNNLTGNSKNEPISLPKREDPSQKQKKHEPIPTNNTKEKYQKPKRLKPSEDPEQVYCLRCSKYHHKDFHKPGFNAGQSLQSKFSETSRNKLSEKDIGYNPLSSNKNDKNDIRDKLATLKNVLGKRADFDYDEDERCYDEEEDYDYSDDFIDNDGIEEDRDFRKELRKVTGYNPSLFDKSKEMFDDRLMEVRDFDVIDREEKKSRYQGNYLIIFSKTKQVNWKIKSKKIY